MDKPHWGLRVQAPLGARVLSFMCCAPNDGFSPQSGLVQRGILYAAAWGSENHTTALTGEMQSPFGGWRHHLSAPLGSVSLDSWVAYSSPMNPVPLPPPQFGWSIKRKALLWAGLGLTLTNLHILCRMCTVAL